MSQRHWMRLIGIVLMIAGVAGAVYLPRMDRPLPVTSEEQPTTLTPKDSAYPPDFHKPYPPYSQDKPFNVTGHWLRYAGQYQDDERYYAITTCDSKFYVEDEELILKPSTSVAVTPGFTVRVVTRPIIVRNEIFYFVEVPKFLGWLKKDCLSFSDVEPPVWELKKILFNSPTAKVYITNRCNSVLRITRRIDFHDKERGVLVAREHEGLFRIHPGQRVGFTTHVTDHLMIRKLTGEYVASVRFPKREFVACVDEAPPLPDSASMKIDHAWVFSNGKEKQVFF